MTDTLVPTKSRPWWQLSREEQARIVPAEAWRKLRAFKRSITPTAANIERALSAETINTRGRLLTDYAFKKGVGRERALAKLKKYLAGATLQAVDDVIIATWLKPSGPIIDSADPGEQQDCVTVWVGFGAKRSAYVAGFSRFLSLEVPDHALARMLQRSPSVDIGSALHEACVTYTCAANAEVLRHIKEDQPFYLRAGDGVFLAKGIVVCEEGRIYTHARARTWISDDMLRPDQKPLPRASADEEPVLNVLLAMTMQPDDEGE